MERCSRCDQGSLQIIAALADRPAIRRILTHLKLSLDPPRLTPARFEQHHLAWTSA